MSFVDYSKTEDKYAVRFRKSCMPNTLTGYRWVT